MALIIDPDSLNQGTEVTISTAARTFTLNIAGNLSADGVTGQAFYSWLKEEWKSDANLIPYPFPMIGITPEQFEFIDGWKLANDASRKLIRTAGWKEIDVTGTTNREYCGITTLGDIDATSKTVGDKAYYSFSSSPSQNFFTYAGPVDEAVQFYGDASNGNFDYTNDTLNLYIRIEGKIVWFVLLDGINDPSEGDQTLRSVGRSKRCQDYAYRRSNCRRCTIHWYGY
jgi:hypothetical protein